MPGSGTGAADGSRRAGRVPPPARASERPAARGSAARGSAARPRAGAAASAAAAVSASTSASAPAAAPERGQQMRAPGRLTAFGIAVLMVGGTLLGALVDRWLFGGPGILFGLVFVVTCFQAAIRVRPIDLAAAPVAGPIAFALALLICGQHSGGGFGARVLGLVTDLALQAIWLFIGTGVAAAITLARHFALRRARRARAAGTAGAAGRR